MTETFVASPACPPESSGAPKPANGARRRRVRVFLAALAVGAASLLAYWLHARNYESTDDAFIESHVVYVSPKVPGQVVRLHVADNQPVPAEGLLVEIDPRDYEVRLAQAKGVLEAARSRLDQAKAAVHTAQAMVDQNKADVVASETEARRAAEELKRYQGLTTASATKQELDNVSAAAESAAAKLGSARKKVAAGEAQVGQAEAAVVAAAADIQQLDASLQQAQLQLSYTKVLAPQGGRVTKRTVEQGAYVQTGQPLLAVVPDEAWVVANFKETQLTHMRPGQEVTVHIDAYPGQEFKAHVDSIQRGTGSRFSLLPPENATGNFVKIVQRVPVKIVFDAPIDPNYPLSPGMSAVPTVKVR